MIMMHRIMTPRMPESYRFLIHKNGLMAIFFDRNNTERSALLCLKEWPCIQNTTKESLMKDDKLNESNPLKLVDLKFICENTGLPGRIFTN